MQLNMSVTCADGSHYHIPVHGILRMERKKRHVRIYMKPTRHGKCTKGGHKVDVRGRLEVLERTWAMRLAHRA